MYASRVASGVRSSCARSASSRVRLVSVSARRSAMWENDVDSASSSRANGSCGTSTVYVPPATVSAATASSSTGRATRRTRNHDTSPAASSDASHRHGDGDAERGGEGLLGVLGDLGRHRPEAREVLVEQPRRHEVRGDAAG